MEKSFKRAKKKRQIDFEERTAAEIAAAAAVYYEPTRAHNPRKLKMPAKDHLFSKKNSTISRSRFSYYTSSKRRVASRRLRLRFHLQKPHQRDCGITRTFSKMLLSACGYPSTLLDHRCYYIICTTVSAINRGELL